MAAPPVQHVRALAHLPLPVRLRAMLAVDGLAGRLLALLPSVFKYTALFLLAVNIRSLPSSWHSTLGSAAL
jgi:hypothetical protein